MTVQNLILSEEKVNRIIKRMAFEIYEHNFGVKQIVIVGIYDKGFLLAERLVNQLETISEGIKIELVRLDIDKSHPRSEEVTLSVALKQLKGRVVILVDDVLNSGKTVAHSMAALLHSEPKAVQIAVLVNRSHKEFPISPNYKGYELSTTIDEHVEVRIDEKEVGVYLY
jgi:pyrimidine operon attenuation protein/uracil phosphoribosyltransferase